MVEPGVQAFVSSGCQNRAVIIRREQAADVAAIRAVVADAFRRPESPDGVPDEVALVDDLRASGAWLPRLSLVADEDGVIVGHVICSRAHVDRTPVLALGPLGVVSAAQRRGIGTALVHASIGAADAGDEPLIVLLGYPAFYRRFGFVPAASLGIVAPDPTWGDHFQARTLATYDPRIRGRFRYAAAFGV